MFAEVETELQDLVAHLESIDELETRIAPVFVTYALTLIHGQFEAAVKAAIRERCKANDPAIDSYVASTVHKSVRSIKLGELSGVLGQFDVAFKASFREQSQEFAVAFQFYSNLESNRQAVAHGGVLSATMGDVVAWYFEAKIVILKFREALGLSEFDVV